MGERSISRWMGPLGLAILVLLLVGFGVLGGSQPNENASGPAVVANFNAHQAQRWAQVYVIGLGLALMLVFVSHLRGLLLRDGGGSRTLANTSFAAGILLVSGLVGSGVSGVVLLLAAHNHQPGIAHTFNFFTQNDELGFLFGMALFVLATGGALLSQAWLPRWLGWVGIVVGVLCVAGPISFLGFILGGVWIAILGFVIGARSRSDDRSGQQRPVSAAVPIGR